MRKMGYISGWILSIIIAIPILLQVLLGGQTTTTSENRSLADFPSFKMLRLDDNEVRNLYVSTVEYKENLNDYLQDQFVLKMSFFNIYASIQNIIFNRNPIPEKVVKGAGGWYFLGDAYSNVILESKRILPFTDKEIQRLRDVLAERRDYAKAKNASYILAVCPNKLSMYGQYLNIQEGKNDSKREQVAQLSHELGVDFIDFGASMKNAELIYYEKTGSHWNDFGAFASYHDLMQEIHKKYANVIVLNRNDLDKKSIVTTDLDLVNMLNISVKEQHTTMNVRHESADQIESKVPIPTFYSRAGEDYAHRFVKKSIDKNGIKALIFRDSFGIAIEKYLKESFDESLFIWKNDFNKALIESEKPDIMIQIIAERDLDDLLK